MRRSVCGSRLLFAVNAVGVGVALLTGMATAAGAQTLHPIESRMRREFPAVALESRATFEEGEAMVGGRRVSGLRAREESSGLRVLYPRFFDEVFVAEAGGQRVVLRAVGARGASAQPTNGKVIYEGTYESVDTIEVPHRHRSEELLLLHDDRAPLVYDYEIVEMSGVAGVVLHEGAIRFMPPAPALSESASGKWEGLAPSLEIERPWVVDGEGRRSESAARWSLGEGPIPRTIRLTLSGGLSYPLVVDPSFTTAGSIGIARFSHTATLLPNGKVLIAGGSNAVALSSATLYDPASGTFSATGSLGTARRDHTATVLPNGKVLITGGFNSGGTLTSAELYDPAGGTFSATGALAGRRATHTATLLPNGKVLIAGGYDPTGDVTSAELYDPLNGTFTTTGPLAMKRASHTATVLPNGKVLVAGGAGTSTSAELYDPASGTFTATGPLSVARSAHTATLVPNGKVLIAGGAGTNASAELFDPAGGTNGTFSATGSLITARQRFTATLLPTGRVLIIGGGDASGGGQVASAEIYDAPSGTFNVTVPMATSRDRHTATLLQSGKVLIAGGFNTSNTSGLASTELYDPVSPFVSATGLPNSLFNPSLATLLPDGNVLIAGGSHVGAEVFNPTSGTFSATGPMTADHSWATATLLTTGKVLIAGGTSVHGGGGFSSAELYDPAGGTFTTTGSMSMGRVFHSATLLPNGKVLVAGGTSGPGSAELYDPVGGTFAATGPLVRQRGAHTATLLTNGKVLLAGGAGTLFSAELYDPASGTFSATSGLMGTTARVFHTATLLPNGKVLIAGGRVVNVYQDSAELYDPASGTFSPTGRITGLPLSHTATLLTNGKVLIAGVFGRLFPSPGAQLYDPATDTFGQTAPESKVRYNHLMALLLNGKVLLAGGGGEFPRSAELYDVGDGYPNTRRPVITSAPVSVAQPASITLSGTGFKGDSEASSGSGTNNSATNYPILQLMRIDNEQTRLVLPGADWSATSFTSVPLTDLPGGHYRATIFVNAIPSLSRVILIIGPPVTVTSVTANTGTFHGGKAVTITGSGFLPGAGVTFGGTAATNVVVVNSTTITATTPAHAAGAVNVTVTNPSSMTATLTAGYTYLGQQFDANGDGLTTPSDIFYLVRYLFIGGPAPAGAAGLLSGDANGDGLVNPADIFYVINYLFLSGPQPYSTPGDGRIAAASVDDRIEGSITLGTPRLRGERYVVPVVVTAAPGAGLPEALALKVRFAAGTVGEISIRRAGAAKAPAFEINQLGTDSLSYLVLDGAGLFANDARTAVIAEIELTSGSAAMPVIDIDPAVTMLSNAAGTRFATVANGLLTVLGPSISPPRRVPSRITNSGRATP